MSPAASERRPLFFLAFVSGALVFAAEVVFTHLLALIIGNSAYAFGLILAAFLSCLFLGASRAAWAQRRFGDAALPLGLAASGLGLAVSLPLWDKLPYFFDNTGEVLTSFAAREATRGVAAFLMLLVPTTLMGLTFPLLLQRVARYSHVGALGGSAHRGQHARRRAGRTAHRLRCFCPGSVRSARSWRSRCALRWPALLVARLGGRAQTANARRGAARRCCSRCSARAGIWRC